MGSYEKRVYWVCSSFLYVKIDFNSHLGTKNAHYHWPERFGSII